MPLGSPGMETTHSAVEEYNVLAIDFDGKPLYLTAIKAKLELGKIRKIPISIRRTQFKQVTDSSIRHGSFAEILRSVHSAQYGFVNAEPRNHLIF